MYRVVIIISVLLVTGMLHSIIGQNQALTSYQDDITHILSLEDQADKIYQLSLFSERFKQFLANKSCCKERLPEGKMQFEKTKGNEYQLFYYTYFKNSAIQKVDWYIRYKIEDRVFVHFFQNEFEEEQIKDDIILKLYDRHHNGERSFEVAFKKAHNPIDFYKVRDLKLKCLFEQVPEYENNAERLEVNKQILQRLNLIWEKAESFDDPLIEFDRMKTIFSPKKEVKICTYNLPLSEFEQLFQGAIIKKEGKNKVNVFPLTDVSGKIRSPERASLSNKKWYGAVYLNIIENSYKGKVYYTLLGHKGHNDFTKKRVVDVLWFAGNKPRFGAAIFKNGRYTYNRLIFEYSAGATMVLQYDAKKKMIVMDNLEPSEPFYRGVYRYYGPDFSYNGYKFEKGKWLLYKDIDLRNPKAN
ncbi:hypothetical protein DMA11_11490 [Marinilabiliaceae bacterium JC017]|nr:hypothetical protein DMA11_11490 [Marinilabiliaceae bacterium JC017]